MVELLTCKVCVKYVLNYTYVFHFSCSLIQQNSKFFSTVSLCGYKFDFITHVITKHELAAVHPMPVKSASFCLNILNSKILKHELENVIT